MINLSVKSDSLSDCVIKTNLSDFKKSLNIVEVRELPLTFIQLILKHIQSL